MKRFLALCATLLWAAPLAAQDCDEHCLLGIAGEYLDGLAGNDVSEVPFAPDVRATENGAAVKPGEGIWKTAQGWLYRHTLADPESGGIVVLGSVNESHAKDQPPRDAVIAVRLKVANRRISESELIVTREGDFPLFSPRAFIDPNPVFARFVPAERRSTRAELEQIARGYFESIIWGDPRRVPFHPDCNRQENGVQTSNKPERQLASCADGMRRFSYMHSYRDIRFPVVDTERGLVMAVTTFDLPSQRRTIMVRGKPHEISPERNRLPRSLFLFELFKVEDGRIRYIEAVLRNMPMGADMGWGGAKGNRNVLPE